MWFLLQHNYQPRIAHVETEALPDNMSETGLLHVSEKLMGRCKKFTACEGRYFEKERVPKPH